MDEQEFAVFCVDLVRVAEKRQRHPSKRERDRLYGRLHSLLETLLQLIPDDEDPFKEWLDYKLTQQIDRPEMLGHMTYTLLFDLIFSGEPDWELYQELVDQPRRPRLQVIQGGKR